MKSIRTSDFSLPMRAYIWLFPGHLRALSNALFTIEGVSINKKTHARTPLNPEYIHSMVMSMAHTIIRKRVPFDVSPYPVLSEEAFDESVELLIDLCREVSYQCPWTVALPIFPAFRSRALFCTVLQFACETIRDENPLLKGSAQS